MRKITQQAVEAFINGYDMHKNNTKVINDSKHSATFMYLHDNLIAKFHRDSGLVIVTLAGWPTPTTRERLNGISKAIGGKRVYQKNFCYFVGDEQIDPNSWFSLN